MNQLKKRHGFRPALVNASLEERQLLSTGAIPAAPPPAPAPVSVARIRMETAQMRAVYMRQFKAAATDLRATIKADVSQLYANGSTPTAQQLADFNAEIAGAVNATALRLSSQAALLPNASAKLIPTIQNSILGSGSNSLASRLLALAQSSRTNVSAQALNAAVATQINRVSSQNVAQVSNFFATTPMNRLSVDSTGQRVPLEVFMGSQLVAQTANTFGSLAATFPTVANAVMFPNGVTETPTQQLFDQFGTQARNALTTAAFQLTSALAVIPGSSAVIPAISPALFGSTSTSLASALQSLPFGSTSLNSAVASTFNTAFQNVITPVTNFLRMTTQSNLALPTTGFTSPFVSAFDTGFNNGFATNGTGFVGFGVAPTTFNTSFGTGFSNVVTNLVTTTGLLGTVTTEGGVPVESR